MSYYFLQPGYRYRVTRPIVDYDGQTHPVGEEWTFLRSSFLPYEDGLSLFVRPDEGPERQIRLQWREEAQGALIDALHSYLEAVRP